MQQLLIAIVGAVAPLLVKLVLMLVSWGIGELALYIRQQRKSAALADALLRLDDAIEHGARASTQRLHELWAKVTDDGRVDADELDQLKEQAVAIAKEAIGPRSLASMLQAIGPDALDAAVGARAEAWIQRLRESHGLPLMLDTTDEEG